MLSDAALNSEQMGNLRQALDYATLAVESAENEEHWVATPGQAERITKLAYYFNKVGAYWEAKESAKKALEFCEDFDCVDEAKGELTKAETHLASPAKLR
jgi:tetratricopeptide (TPR) repeat protein